MVHFSITWLNISIRVHACVQLARIQKPTYTNHTVPGKGSPTWARAAQRGPKTHALATMCCRTWQRNPIPKSNGPRAHCPNAECTHLDYLFEHGWRNSEDPSIGYIHPDDFRKHKVADEVAPEGQVYVWYRMSTWCNRTSDWLGSARPGLQISQEFSWV